MWKVRHRVSDRQVAANQSNAQKSTGPKTREGKARAALNAIKHGAYAKAENVRREIMVRRGEDPAEYEQLHQDLVDSCQPEDALQAMVVKTIGDKTWDKLKLRQVSLEAQLGSVQLAQARLQRRQLTARRWPVAAHPGDDRGLCGSKDSPNKFNPILQHLDRLQDWFEKGNCPDEYPDVMGELYGECPTSAGQQIRQWFIQLFDDDQAQCQKARQELPQWIAKERSDVLEDRELYHREVALRRFDVPSTPEDEVAAKEALLERQIAEQTRLLLQLKSKRSLWGRESEAGEAGVSGGEIIAGSPENSTQASRGHTGVPPGKDNSQGTATKDGPTGCAEGSASETAAPAGEVITQEAAEKGHVSC
jgi:hypothetical protein